MLIWGIQFLWVKNKGRFVLYCCIDNKTIKTSLLAGWFVWVRLILFFFCPFPLNWVWGVGKIGRIYLRLWKLARMGCINLRGIITCIYVYFIISGLNLYLRKVYQRLETKETWWRMLIELCSCSPLQGKGSILLIFWFLLLYLKLWISKKNWKRFCSPLSVFFSILRSFVG